MWEERGRLVAFGWVIFFLWGWLIPNLCSGLSIACALGYLLPVGLTYLLPVHYPLYPFLFFLLLWSYPLVFLLPLLNLPNYYSLPFGCEVLGAPNSLSSLAAVAGVVELLAALSLPCGCD